MRKPHLFFGILLFFNTLFYVQELFSNGETDYFLYIFGAVVYGNLGEMNKAIELYKTAITIDENKPLAWQGLYKLLEKDALIIDNFALIVAEKMLSLFGWVFFFLLSFFLIILI